jgi:DNA-binding MarR family transcriptional regulator
MTAAADEDDPLRLDRQVCFPLYAATNLINRLYGPVLGELGLTYPQYLVMLVLWEFEPRTVGEVGARLYLDSGTLTPLLKRMEASGLLVRRRDPEDERRVLVALTDEGRGLRARARHVPQTMASGLAPEGLDELRDAVRGLVATLAQHSGTKAGSTPRADGPGRRRRHER